MTPRILPLADEQVPAGSRAILQQTQAALGMVPNLHRTLAHAPAALRAYSDSVRALAGGKLEPALREQIALATAGTNGCGYCASAHTALGAMAGLEPAEMSKNLAARSDDPRVASALALVRELVERRGAVSDATLRAVRDAGFGDAEIVEMVAHAGLNTFTNVFNTLARTTIDFPEVALRGAACEA